MKKQSRQHDELQTSRSDMRKAAKRYAKRISGGWGSVQCAISARDFLAGVKAERRRRAKEGY